MLLCAVRELYADLSNVKQDDPKLVKALKFAKRCHEQFLLNDFGWGTTSPERFRERGTGRKSKTLEVLEAMFGWFFNIRETLKGHLPIKMFRSKCQPFYLEWLEQQPVPIAEDEQLQFGKHWIQDWMSEYYVSAREPNRRYSSKMEHRVVRIQDHLKNILIVRKFFLDTYGIGPPIINREQMPLYRNERASQRTLSLKSETTFVKENYMLSGGKYLVLLRFAAIPKSSCSQNLSSKVKTLGHTYSLLQV